MARFTADLEVLALGEALACLRRAAGLSQAEAGGRVGMTSQGWGLYESGRRPGLFRPDVQRRLTGALDATPEDMAIAAAKGDAAAYDSLASGFESAGRNFAAAAPIRPTDHQRMQVSNDDLSPWAASGVILEFDVSRWPRRDQGCVIDLADGRRLVRLYDRADADSVHLRGGPEGLASHEAVPRRDIVRIAAVVARLDR